jgi:2-succinyl-5-enolpyruvyl-6-hydroxy-3-cyclohexene-1-carboxylate synthase
MWSLVDGLASRGVRLASISPGSRSTAIALALSRHPAIDLHVHLDERASAFFALGAAKATGVPAIVACTSGTAAANLFPAIVEASMSRVPLVVLTADRPPELRGVGANQTIDQIELYGRYVRSFEDAPVRVDGDEDEWRHRGEAAASTAVAHPPGPVHLNLPFREPLVPTDTIDLGASSESSPVFDTTPAPSPADLDAITERIRDVERGVVFSGGLRREAPAVAELARWLGWPLIAEPHSGLRSGDALSAPQFLLADEAFAATNRPDAVLQFGAAPTSRASLSYVGHVERLVIVDPDDLVADPARRADLRVVADADATARCLIERGQARRTTTWLESWRDADERARRAVDRTIDGWDEPFEGRVARDVADAIPSGSQLLVGSSLPIRDLDAYMRPRDGVRILANRGASGIDGFVSTILGASTAGAPTFALLGDLTLLHDIGSLVWSAGRGYHAVLVVLNNGGGAIFSMLEQQRLPELEPLFTTPHGSDLGTIVRAAGLDHVRVTRVDDLIPAMRDGRQKPSIRVLDVAIDAGSDVERREEIHRAVATALS